MNQLAPVIASQAPALVAASGGRASYRFLEFFTAQIRNPHRRRAYARAASEFFDWLEAKGVTQLTAIESVHVATYIEQLQRTRSAPTAKLRLAALRHLFDWMVIGQITPTNPAAAVRGPRHVVRRGKSPVLDPAEARQLIDAIDTTTVIGLRDRALIGLMVYSFARIGAAIGMRVEDVYTQNRLRLHEKGGKQHAMPCHHNLESYLHEYIDGAALASDPKALLFQTYRRATGRLTGNPLPQANAYPMIQRRGRAAEITTKIGNHTFRATGVTAYLKNGGTLERAAQMANHASTRTTQLYDRRAEEVTLDEVERILVESRISGARRNGAKTSLFWRKNVAVLAEKSPVRRTRFPCSSNRGGGSRRPSCALGAAPAARPLPLGAASATLGRGAPRGVEAAPNNSSTGSCGKCWRTSGAVLHLFSNQEGTMALSLPPGRFRPRPPPSPAWLPPGDAGNRPHIRAAPAASAPRIKYFLSQALYS